jgi:hypothetical protein
VDREYELFERLPDGDVLWRGTTTGLEQARQKLEEFGRETRNELYAMHLFSHQVVARVNAPDGQPKTIKHVFQIAYDGRLLSTRAGVLKAQGYKVVSVLGNESAKAVLGHRREYDLFVVGHAASQETRIEMVAWLKARYPKAKILALNPPDCVSLDGADYNAKQNGPDTWLPIVTTALAA